MINTLLSYLYVTYDIYILQLPGPFKYTLI